MKANGFVHIKTVANKIAAKLQERSTELWQICSIPEGGARITTGFAELDLSLGGLYDGGMYVIAGRPGMGKTAFTLQVALNVLQNGKRPVYYFSNYLTAEELLIRFVSIIGGIDSYSMRQGLLSEKEWEAAAKAVATLSSTELYVSHTPFPEADSIARFIREEVRDGMVVIDGIQEVCLNRNRPFHQKILNECEMAIISREFKLAALDAGVPVLITSQLTRELELRGDKTPCLEDLERSAGLLQSDADGVILLYREAYYHDSDNEDKAQVILAKNRWGGTVETTVGFDGRCARFYDIAK